MELAPPMEPEKTLRPDAEDGAPEQCMVRAAVERGDSSGVAICDVVCCVIEW